jgi:hypothetical protein
MTAYTNEPSVNKSLAPFELTAHAPRARLHLTDSVTHALAAMRVRVWSLASRLSRTWDNNPNHQSGNHAAERWARERQLVADVKRLEQTGHFMECARHAPRLRAAYLSVIADVHRLLAAGDWWKPEQLVDRTTGEVTTRVYLPEDTWAAQGALAWAVGFLVRLVAAVPRVTERVTPRYRTEDPARASGRSTAAVNDEEWAAWLAARREKYGGAQPELPATA